MQKLNSIEFWKNYKKNIHVLSLTDEFKCAVCQVIMIEPYLLSCAHLYCLDCKNGLSAKDKKICVICKEEIEQEMLEKRIIKRQKETEIPCLNSNLCIWKGDITNFANHCDKCGYLLIFCDLGCQEKIQRNELENHQSYFCDEREIYCKYCNFSQKFKNYENHLENVCMEFPVNCPNECKINEVITTIKRKDKELHISKCENQIISCDFCKQSLRRKEMENHFKNSIFPHMILINKEIIQNKKEISDLKEIINDLQKENSTKDKELINIRKEQKSSKNKIIKMEKILKLKKKFNSLKLKVNMQNKPTDSIKNDVETSSILSSSKEEQEQEENDNEIDINLKENLPKKGRIYILDECVKKLQELFPDDKNLTKNFIIRRMRRRLLMTKFLDYNNFDLSVRSIDKTVSKRFASTSFIKFSIFIKSDEQLNLNSNLICFLKDLFKTYMIIFKSKDDLKKVIIAGSIFKNIPHFLNKIANLEFREQFFITTAKFKVYAFYEELIEEFSRRTDVTDKNISQDEINELVQEFENLNHRRNCFSEIRKLRIKE